MVIKGVRDMIIIRCFIGLHIVTIVMSSFTLQFTPSLLLTTCSLSLYINLFMIYWIDHLKYSMDVETQNYLG